MKKLFKTFALAGMLVPFAFLAVGCGDKETPYDKEANVQAYNQAVESYQAVGTNYKQTIDVSISESLKLMMDEQSLADIQALEGLTVYIDGDDYKIVMPNQQEIFKLDGKVFQREYTELSGWSGLTASETAEMSVPNVVNSLDFDDLQDFAFKFNNEAINTTKTSNGSVVTITLDMDSILNKALNVVKANKTNSLENLINAMLVEFGVNDVTVESVVESIKSSITAETTVGDIVDAIELATGVDLLESVVSGISGATSSFLVTSEQTVNDGVYCAVYENAFESMPMLADIDALRSTTILSLIDADFSKTEFDAKIDEIKTLLETKSLTDIINEKMGTPEEPQPATSLFNLLDLVRFETLHLNIKLKTDSNNNFVGYGVEFIGSIAVFTQTMDFSMGVDFNYSEVDSVEIALPTNSSVESVELNLTADVDLTGEITTLTISNVSFDYLESFSITNASNVDVVVYNKTEKTLTIDASLLSALKAQNDALSEDDDEFNALVVLADYVSSAGTVNVKLNILL